MQWSTLWEHTRRTISLPHFTRTSWRLLLMVTALSLPAAGPAQARLFGDVVVVGDSLSDIGNVLVLTRPTPDPIPASPPYASGRFSNGPVWAEVLAQRFDLRLSSSLEGGLNFAFGGAEVDVDRRDVLEVDVGVTISSLLTQADTFHTMLLLNNEVDRATLYLVWGGANDVRDALRTEADPLRESRDAARALGQVIRKLADDDAVYFLVPNLPDLGRTPEIRAKGPEAVAQATAASMAFNETLTATLDAIEAERQVYIARLDTFARLEEIVAAPAAFGLTNVIDACLMGDYVDGGTPCATPATYLFWDALHPSAAAHALLAQFAAAVLPPLVVTEGTNSPEETPEVSLPAQNLPVLQARLSTGDQAVLLTSLRLDFTKPESQASRVRSLRAQLSDDANANGRLDAGETVLATGQVQGAVGSLLLTLPTPLNIPAATTRHLLVTLAINSPTTTVAALQGASPGPIGAAQGTPRGYMALLLPALGLLLRPRRSALARRPGRRQGVLLLALGCALLLISCDAKDAVEDLVNGDESNRNAFTVTMPAEGSSAQGAVSGAITFPPATLTGATVRID